MKKLLFVLLASLAVFSFSACEKENPLPDPVHGATTPYTIKIPARYPTLLNIPADNPMTVEGIALGRLLFYDGRLRGGGDDPDSLMSCGTCHLQSRSFECGIDHPEFTGGFTHGIKCAQFPNGKPTPHVMLPLINLVFNTTGYLWNGSIYTNNPVASKRNLEDLVWMGIHAAHEMKSDTNKAKAAIQAIPMYPPLFKKAFGSDVVTAKNMGKAIAQFVRTLIADNSKAHQVFLNKGAQFTDAERRGYVLFVTENGADCFHCHGSEGSLLFTTNLFYNNAKDTLFNDPRDRYAVTGDPMDKGAYKATTLINIEFTGPYMHDGRFATLDQVINFYSHGLMWSPYASSLMHNLPRGGAQLSPSQKADLKAFLLTLTDQTFLTNPAFSKPAGIP